MAVIRAPTGGVRAGGAAPGARPDPGQSRPYPGRRACIGVLVALTLVACREGGDPPRRPVRLNADVFVMRCMQAGYRVGACVCLLKQQRRDVDAPRRCPAPASPPRRG